MQRHKYPPHPPAVRNLTLTSDPPPSFELAGSSRQIGGGIGAGGSGLAPLAMRNTVKGVGKEVKLQKKQPRKDKLANYHGGRREDRPSLGVKKPASSSRRSKPGAAEAGGGGGRRNSHAPQMAAGHAGDKILSMEGLFSE